MTSMKPIRGKIVDWWILPHFCFFVVLGSTVESIASPDWWVHLVYGAICTVAWEIIEHFLERKFRDAWSWREEHVINKWVTDPISNMIGLLVGVLGVMFYRGMM
jgi:hypothetical protein